MREFRHGGRFFHMDLLTSLTDRSASVQRRNDEPVHEYTFGADRSDSRADQICQPHFPRRFDKDNIVGEIIIMDPISYQEGYLLFPCFIYK